MFIVCFWDSQGLKYLHKIFESDENAMNNPLKVVELSKIFLKLSACGGRTY